MKAVLIIIHFFFSISLCVAQGIPWKFTPTTKKHVISIQNGNFTFENKPLRKGDIIGVFYDSVGYLACGGYAIWPANQIIAYGNTSMGDPNGFSTAGPGEVFKLKLWRSEENCIADSLNLVQFQSNATYPQYIYFQDGGKSKMITLNFVFKQVDYAKRNYCTGDPNPSPIIIGTLPGLKFASQDGLVIDENTGVIDLAGSTPGSYTVYFNTNLCLKTDRVKLTIKLNVDNINVGITKSTCTEKGQVQIDQSTIICGTAPYQYRLRNIGTGQETSSGIPVFNDLSDATYELFIKDANGVEAKWKNLITITKECKDLIISPNTPGGQTAYFIPYQGTAKIYDRFGLLKKEMAIPADWDATDNTGNQVSMGQYVIICNEDQQIVVTVIK